MKTAKRLLSVFTFLLCVQFTIAQNQNVDIDLISSYEDYTEMDRELVYAHLNKSIYIKGESIGLNAYVLDKYTKKLATQAANLYCTISNNEGEIIESKLFMINNGTAVGDFEIDDEYTTGDYTVKVYTNWMRNFNEQNLFVETIKIIDPEAEQQIISKTDITKVDAQFLPEGGHFLYDVENTVGVVIKSDQGLGLPNIEGEIVDQNDVVVTNFKVNQFGIGKCLLTPKTGYTYKAKFNYLTTEHTINIEHIKAEGIVMSLTTLKDKIALKVKTNTSTFETINQHIYKLAIHNGQDLKEISFKFGTTTEVVKVIANQDLYKGINIFTIFDANNNPLLERLHFNFNGVNFQTSGEATTAINNDSISIVLPYKLNDVNAINNFSVSVLPNGTNSFLHQNIASYALLQPYVKSYIEQANYYFTAITPKKQFELDNLLITQAWSSYDWNTIFNNPPEYDYDYENGISYTLNSQDKGDKQLMIYPSLNHSTTLISLTKDNASYTATNFFPTNDEVVVIRNITSDGSTKPNLYLQFDPFTIPEITSDFKPLAINAFNSEFLNMDASINNAFKNIEALDEIIINNKKGYTEIEKLQNRSLGKVEAIDEVLIKRYRTVVRYLRDRGFTIANAPGGKFEVYNNQRISFRNNAVEGARVVNSNEIDEYEDPNAASIYSQPLLEHHEGDRIYQQDTSTIPVVYIDGIIFQQNLEILQTLNLEDIEYIEVNKSGVGGGMRAGGAGLIRIKTKPNSRVKVENKELNATYEVPLKFSVSKKFYIPRYTSYDSDFFQQFGVIDWLPNLKADNEGNVKFNICNNGLTDLKLFIEGISNDGTFISEVKELNLN
nr:hypothetical protein [uncultured Psychroserpens sp.]